jgi:D-sedoheptulose 7-phosphate isomerase
VESWQDYLLKLRDIGNMADVSPNLELLLTELIEVINSENGIVFTAGNGGSASTAEHFSADLSQMRKRVKTNCKSICLNSSVSLNSALANDLSYSETLQYIFESLINESSMLITFSASGNSENIYHLHRLAKERGLSAWAFLGFDGGRALEMVKDRNILFKTTIGSYGLVENLHLSATHFLVDGLVEHFRNNT